MRACSAAALAAGLSSPPRSGTARLPTIRISSLSTLTSAGAVNQSSGSRPANHAVTVSDAAVVMDYSITHFQNIYNRVLVRVRFMRVVVDFDLCQSNALCMAEAPEVFEVRDDGFLYILNET